RSRRRRGQRRICYPPRLVGESERRHEHLGQPLSRLTGLAMRSRAKWVGLKGVGTDAAADLIARNRTQEAVTRVQLKLSGSLSQTIVGGTGARAKFQRHLVCDLAREVLPCMFVFGPANDICVARMRFSVWIKCQSCVQERGCLDCPARFHGRSGLVYMRRADSPNLRRSSSLRTIDRRRTSGES